MTGLARQRRCSRRRRPSSTSSSARSRAFFLFRGGAALRLRRLLGPQGHRRGHHDGQRRPRRPPAAGCRAHPRRAALQGRRGAVPPVDPGRLPGRPDPGHRLHGRLHQARRVRRVPAAHLRRRRREPLGLADRRGRHRRSSRWSSVPSSRSPRPTSSELLACTRRWRAGFILVGVLAFSRAAVGGVMFYLLAYGATDHRGLRHRHDGPPGRFRAFRTCRSGPASVAATRSSPASSPSCCWPSRASR